MQTIKSNLYNRAYSRRKGHACNFSEKGKIIGNLGKNVKNLKIFWKGAETASICPV